jgi:hypothetical protein
LKVKKIKGGFHVKRYHRFFQKKICSSLKVLYNISRQIFITR